MRCIAANRSVLTTLDQNATLPDNDNSNQTATTNDIDCMDIIQFADGWYSYPDLNTFDSALLLDTLTIRVITSHRFLLAYPFSLSPIAYQSNESPIALEYQGRESTRSSTD
jgi:hypothetical protein